MNMGHLDATSSACRRGRLARRRFGFTRQDSAASLDSRDDTFYETTRADAGNKVVDDPVPTFLRHERMGCVIGNDFDETLVERHEDEYPLWICTFAAEMRGKFAMRQVARVRSTGSFWNH